MSENVSGADNQQENETLKSLEAIGPEGLVKSLQNDLENLPIVDMSDDEIRQVENGLNELISKVREITDKHLTK